VIYVLFVWALPVLWLAAFFACTAMGRVAGTVAPDRRHSLFDQFWAGAAVAVAALQVVHFVAPIRPAVTLLIATACAVVGVWDGLARLRRVPRMALVTLALFTAWTAVASLNEPPQVDFGLYHLQSVRWNQSLPIVPGLANLYWPLGQNSGAFLLAAALDPGSFTSIQAYHIAGALFVVVLAAEACVALANLLSSHRTQPSDLFRVFGLPLAGSLVGNWLPTLSPDVAVTVLGYAAATRLAEALLDEGRSSAAANVALLIAGAGMAMKLTSAPYFAMMIMVSAWAALRGDAKQVNVRNVGIVCVLVASWIAGAWVVSGYPLYPWSGLHTDVPWLMPRARLESYVLATFWHVRASGPDVTTEKWLTTVWPHLIWTSGKFQVLVPSGLGALAGIIIVLCRLRPSWKDYRILIAPAACGATAWFVGAPEPRFAGAVFWHGGVATVTVAATAALSLRPPDLVRRAIAATAAGLLFVYILTGVRARDLRFPWEGAVLSGAPALRPFVTRSGLRVWVPIRDGRCLDAPWPCTPEPWPDLALRRPPDLGAGFVIREGR
jgi:hypothetical protein